MFLVEIYGGNENKIYDLETYNDFRQLQERTDNFPSETIITRLDNDYYLDFDENTFIGDVLDTGRRLMMLDDNEKELFTAISKENIHEIDDILSVIENEEYEVYHEGITEEKYDEEDIDEIGDLYRVNNKIILVPY